jgi:hypothetical protein
LAKLDTNLCSPANSEINMRYSGVLTREWINETYSNKSSGNRKLILTWLLRCVRPNCWIALSSYRGNSIVMWRRRRWFLTNRSAFKKR